MKWRILPGAALLAVPVSAQVAGSAAAAAQQPAPAAEAAAPVAIDPARLALARTTVGHFWPIGTYERMMAGSIDQMMDQMFEAIVERPVGELAGPYAPAVAADPELARISLRELMEKVDPHFKERHRIMNRVMTSAMMPMMNRIEPDIREGMARAYARKFTAEQLADMNRFFATPSGRAYASESMMLFVDPEIMLLMGKMATELAREMPAITEKVKEATAHLPLPPLPDRGKGGD